MNELKVERGFHLPVKITLLQLLCGCLAYTLFAMTRSGIPGTLFSELQSDLKASATAVSAIGSIGFLSSMLAMSYTGGLVDRHGCGVPMALGCAIIGIGMLCEAMASHVALLWLGAFCLNHGGTYLYLSVLKLFDISFERRYFAVVMGMFYLFSYGGNAIGTSPFNRACALWNWRGIEGTCSRVMVLLAAAIFLCSHVSGKSAKSGGAATSGVKRQSLLSFIREHMTFRYFQLFYCGAFLIGAFWSMQSIAGKKMLQDAMVLDSRTAADIVSGMSVTVMIMMICCGTLSLLLKNRRKPFLVYGAVMMALSLLGMLAGITWNLPVWFMRVVFILFGSSFGVASLYIATSREYSPIASAATAIALMNFMGNILSILFGQLGGFLLDLYGGTTGIDGRMVYSPEAYCLLLASMASLAVLGAVFSFFIKESRGKNISDQLKSASHTPASGNP